MAQILQNFEPNRSANRFKGGLVHNGVFYLGAVPAGQSVAVALAPS